MGRRGIERTGGEKQGDQRKEGEQMLGRGEKREGEKEASPHQSPGGARPFGIPLPHAHRVVTSSLNRAPCLHGSPGRRGEAPTALTNSPILCDLTPVDPRPYFSTSPSLPSHPRPPHTEPPDSSKDTRLPLSSDPCRGRVLLPITTFSPFTPPLAPHFSFSSQQGHHLIPEVLPDPTSGVRSSPVLPTPASPPSQH